MAVTQVSANKRGSTNIAQKDSDGYYYIQEGAIRKYQGTGSPNGIITAPKGSWYVELGGPDLYMNTDAGTTWELVGGQS